MELIGQQHAFRDDIDYYEQRAFGLCASAADRTATALAAFERWDAPLTEAGARAVIAREHGLPSWAALERHVASLPERDEPFVRAYRAIEAHDVDGLREELERSPRIVATRGTNGNDLLGMATATCDERLVQLLLEHGADPTRANVHGATPLHQAAYAGLPQLTRIVLDAGGSAGMSARGEGGTPLITALFWGHRETAELLAGHGVLPPNLRAAAGLGRSALIEGLVPAGGPLAPEAGAQRGFYRPHSGFPPWRPSDDPGEILDEALSWAARNDRLEALDLLVERGGTDRRARGAREPSISLDADVYRGTALAWATACGRIAAIRRLLALGANPNGLTSFGGPDHGEAATALHLAAEGGRLEAIEVLLDAGADPTIHDARHDHPPAGWAEHGGQTAARDLLRERGG